jgi:hypothetical protein
MYRIEYHGKLLDGFNPEIVRMDVAVRLHLRDAQLERLFSGERVVLKRAVSEQAAAHYLHELRTMGLDARMVPIGEVAPAAALTYAVVFWGHVLPGLDRAAVMAAAARRFRVTPAQVMQIFSGSKVVLKRGVDTATGARWVTDLAVIGMQVELELEVSALPALQPASAQSVPPAEEEHPFGGLLRTACDLSGTPFSGYGEGVAETPPAGPLPVIPPPRMPQGASSSGSGYAPAAQYGFVNCPACGHYQPQTGQCVKCGAALPVPRNVMVGKAAPTGNTDPTVVVPHEESVVRALPNLPKHGRQPESLRDLMLRQQSVEAESSREFPLLRVVVAVLILAVGAAWYFLSH